MITWIDTVLDLYPRKYNPIGVELTYLCAIIGIGSIVLFALLIAPARARSMALRAAGIVVAVVAVPVAILYAFAAQYGGTVWSCDPRINNNIVWLGLETGLALACLVLYLCRKWPVPHWATALLLVGHLSLWGCVVSQLFHPLAWGLSLSIVPACSALAWIFYVRREEGQSA